LAVAGDPQSLAREAVPLVCDSNRYAETCRRAVEWAERFSWDATAAALFDVAESISSEVDHARPSVFVNTAAARW
jgi:hypothetical protein